MGLDASVRCDCFENRKITSPPPFRELVRLSEEGRPEIYTEDFQQALSFDAWEHSRPCPHERFTLLHHYIGNITRVANLREQVARLGKEHAVHFPIILERVVYSGVHGGDRLTVSQGRLLRDELEKLSSISAEEVGIDRERIDYFIRQMTELVSLSLTYSKPIVF
jgi:hypothetical protein